MCFNPHTHEGCDKEELSDAIERFSFNPHTHEGCDCWKLNFWLSLYVSIHTPTKGVTLWISLSLSLSVSIHTPTKGVTFRLLLPSYHDKFQSTHPRRVWLLISEPLFRAVSFNPHTHEGCDVYVLCSK